MPLAADDLLGPTNLVIDRDVYQRHLVDRITNTITVAAGCLLSQHSDILFNE